jgi:hypothetical protein
MTKEERIAYVKKYGITPPECNCGSCPCLEDIDKAQQGGTCRLTHSFHKFTDICDCPKQRYWEVEIGPPPKINTEPNICTKSLYGYSFHIKCTCGFEANVESFYWDRFKLCPGCGTTCEEE